MNEHDIKSLFLTLMKHDIRKLMIQNIPNYGNIAIAVKYFYFHNPSRKYLSFRNHLKQDNNTNLHGKKLGSSVVLH